MHLLKLILSRVNTALTQPENYFQVCSIVISDLFFLLIGRLEMKVEIKFRGSLRILPLLKAFPLIGIQVFEESTRQ